MSDLKTKTKVKTAFKNYSLDIIKILNITTTGLFLSLFHLKLRIFLYIYLHVLEAILESFRFLMKVNILKHYSAAEY